MNVGDEKLSDQTSSWNDKLAINSGHEVEARCYRCSFCKRGFSNAQALGGHMNIHRKDRAKLKEFSDENLLTLDINSTADFCGEGSENGEETRKMGCDGKLDDDAHGMSSDENSTFGLRLFAEAPSMVIVGEDKGLEKRGMEVLIRGDQVDLELRLGYEPHDAKIN